MKIGEKIRKIRREKDITQEALAQQIGCKQQTIVAYEKNQRDLSVTKLEQIAKVLNVPVASFFQEEGRC